MPRKRKETRATFYNIKATPLARVARKSLSSIKAKLDKMQQPWGEADPLIEAATARAVEALEELSAHSTQRVLNISTNRWKSEHDFCD